MPDFAMEGVRPLSSPNTFLVPLSSFFLEKSYNPLKGSGNAVSSAAGCRPRRSPTIKHMLVHFDVKKNNFTVTKNFICLSIILGYRSEKCYCSMRFLTDPHTPPCTPLGIGVRC